VKTDPNGNPVMKTKPEKELGQHFIKVEINGKEIEAMIDSGACVIIISEALCKLLLDATVMHASTIENFQGFGHSKVHVLGQVELALQIGRLRTPLLSIIVVPTGSCSQSLVLGLDFLENHFMVLNTVDSVLFYTPPNETSHSIPLLRQTGLEVVGNIKVINKNLIKARERQIIQASVKWKKS
jgi:hypothetical protein